MTDEQLMMAVKAGEIAQMRILFERYKTDLYQYFYAQTRHQDVSEDLTQNVFERIIQYRQSFKGDGKFKNWMYRIASNIMTDEKRRYAKQMTIKENLEDWDESGSHTQEENIIQDELLQQALRAMKNLSEDAQRMIWMSWKQNMRYADIAEVMESTEGNIRVRMHRAIKKLRTEYQRIAS